MSFDEITDVPKLSGGDVAYTAAKSALTMVPLAGSALAEVFALVLAAPLAKRRDEWMHTLAKRLVALEDKVSGFKLDELSKNEAFVSTAFQAGAAAIKTHHEEKRRALQNAVLNTALGIPIDAARQEIFVHLIDQFTPWHSSILRFFDDPSAPCTRRDVSPSSRRVPLREYLKHTFPRSLDSGSSTT